MNFSNRSQLVRRGRSASPFDFLFDNFARTERCVGSFLVDLAETDTEYRFEAELPGVDEGQVNVTLEDGVLSIQAERSAETGSEESGQKHVERHFGTFVRRFSLPATTL